jgi:glycosyltransferase involved in cell wall biosynthesis
LAHKFVTIPNGFDEADFDGVCPSGSAVSPPDKFVIRYVGSMGGCRQADDLLAVLRSLGEHRMWHDLRLDFLGPFNQPKQPWMDALGDRVQFRPSVAHRQALRELRSAAVLLLVQNPECGPEFAVPGKAYEYAAARVPILALTPAGEVQKLVETYRLGRSVDSTDHPRLTETLLEMYDAWRRKETHSPEASFFRVFSRRAEAKVLSGLLCG